MQSRNKLIDVLHEYKVNTLVIWILFFGSMPVKFILLNFMGVSIFSYFRYELYC